MNKILLLVALFLLQFTPLVVADVFKADGFFNLQQYDKAKLEYLKAAKVGNPHAYFQLARMNLKGLGDEPDVATALLYYSLAAEQDFLNANAIVQSVLETLPAQSQDEIKTAFTKYKKSNGIVAVKRKYFPRIKKETLVYKVNFDGKEALEKTFYSDDFDGDSLFDDLSFGSGDEEEDGENTFGIATPRQPFLILDIDITGDGSVRHHSNVQRNGGNADAFIKDFILFPQPRPTFQSRNIDFIHRVYLGVAGLNKFALRDENETLYRAIRKKVRRLKKGESIHQRYEYAMALLNFEWLNQEPKEAEESLLALAKEGHPSAMYEYGILLYREQRDIEQAVYWISEAAKYGLIRAEYRLGKLLQDSPWVVGDEEKALFWYESAANKGYTAAKMRIADIKLRGYDRFLRDVNGAIKILNSIKGKDKNNPEYYYLLALSYRDRVDRDFSFMRSNLRKAIGLGQRANWDVSDWQALLRSLTTGTVTSCESVGGKGEEVCH